MNLETLETMVKSEAEKAKLTISFFSVLETANGKMFKVMYQDQGGRSTKCNDCPSKLVTYAYVEKYWTGAEVMQELKKMVKKIEDHYGLKAETVV